MYFINDFTYYYIFYFAFFSIALTLSILSGSKTYLIIFIIFSTFLLFIIAIIDLMFYYIDDQDNDDSLIDNSHLIDNTNSDLLTYDQLHDMSADQYDLLLSELLEENIDYSTDSTDSTNTITTTSAPTGTRTSTTS